MAEKLKLADAWYKEGLKFKCTGCGKCCTGSPGYVWLTEEEAASIANYLNIDVDSFFKKYVREVKQRFALIELKSLKNPEDFDCVFLHENRCAIYPVRPQQCRKFPWWQMNLGSQAQWEEAAEYCEGIDHPEGTHYTAEEIQRRLNKD